MTAMLDLEGVLAFYGQTQALFGVDLRVEQGGITAILGANGAGKTTTLRAISGMVRNDGAIRFEGHPIGRRDTEDITRLGIAHVPSGRGNFLRLTVAENLRLGSYVRRDRDGIATDLEQIYRYFPVLMERRRQQAGTLSGGEQQMLAIARALMLSPRLLLLDEPSFGLAPILVRKLFDIMGRINQEQGISILLVEQNVALALDLADRACLLETGRVLVSGSSAEIRDDARVRSSYLGH
jgi:branched-chain amino acid transport system ATP-binding protein